MLKERSAFKMRANNLKCMTKPLYSENRLHQSSKCSPLPRGTGAESPAELVQVPLFLCNICSATEKPIIYTGYN